MWIRILFIALLLFGLGWADDQADYDRLKASIQEQKRKLNKEHSLRHYGEAMATQKVLADLSNQALQLALKSPQIGDSGAWNYHADTLKDAGLHQEALEAVTKYLATPLLDRNGFRNGWRKRSQIYKRLGQPERALECLEQALTFSDDPRDQFYVYRDRANIHLDEAQPEDALRSAQKMTPLADTVDEKHHLSVSRDLQSTLVRVHKELGNAGEARQARRKEWELRKEILDADLANFDQKYPTP